MTQKWPETFIKIIKGLLAQNNKENAISHVGKISSAHYRNGIQNLFICLRVNFTI